MDSVVSLLERPVYGMAEVDDVLRLRPGTARRWIDGYQRRRPYPPVVRLEATGSDVVTWGEFVETRLLAEYRDAGVPMVHLRPTVERLRDELGVRYPLAYASTWLEPHGNELVRRVQEEAGTSQRLRFVVVRNDQLVLALPAQRFVDAVEFDQVVRRLQPERGLRVYIDPERQAGRPVVRSVPTEVIAELHEAGDPVEQIAELYALDVDLVNEAIRYESIRRPRTATAV
ncbi:MAG: DUF433 domain-containing protein [Chloroflexi bacterium]|nr:DUF433 domain-containing protein [Chloroflexota bacterium]